MIYKLKSISKNVLVWHFFSSYVLLIRNSSYLLLLVVLAINCLCIPRLFYTFLTILWFYKEWSGNKLGTKLCNLISVCILFIYLGNFLRNLWHESVQYGSTFFTLFLFQNYLVKTIAILLTSHSRKNPTIIHKKMIFLKLDIQHWLENYDRCFTWKLKWYLID